MHTETATRILLVDDHPIFRWGVAQYISKLDGFELIGEASDGNEALSIFRRELPHIVLLDLEMPGLCGAGFLSLLSEIEREHTKVIILTQSSSSSVSRELQKLGIAGYVLKSEGIEEISKALKAVVNGGLYFSPATAQRLWEYMRENSSAIGEPVSNREFEIARLVSDGLSSKEIADDLGCAVSTVKTHRANLMRKIGAKSSVDVARWVGSRI